MLKLKLVETFPLKDGLVLSIILYLPVILLSVTLYAYVMCLCYFFFYSFFFSIVIFYKG